jgi:hypothetical protein
VTLNTPLWLQQASYPAQIDRQLIGLWTGGVINRHTDLVVSADATTLSVDVAPGSAVIPGGDQAFQGSYLCQSTAIVNLPINARPTAGQTRLDLVYAKVIDSTAIGAGNPANDGWQILVAAGVPSASSPARPALPASSIALAQVSVAGGGGATFNPADITDLRGLGARSVARPQYGNSVAVATNNLAGAAVGVGQTGYYGILQGVAIATQSQITIDAKIDIILGSTAAASETRAGIYVTVDGGANTPIDPDSTSIIFFPSTSGGQAATIPTYLGATYLAAAGHTYAFGILVTCVTTAAQTLRARVRALIQEDFG